MAWVWSLVRELRSCMLHHWAKRTRQNPKQQHQQKDKTKKERKEKTPIYQKLMSWDKENVPSTSPLPGHLPLFHRLSCWVILLSLLFGWGRKWEISPVMTWILASRMKSKSDKVGTKIISGEGELLSGLLVPSAVQFWKANMGNSNTRAWKDSFSHLMSVECVPFDKQCGRTEE